MSQPTATGSSAMPSAGASRSGIGYDMSRSLGLIDLFYSGFMVFIGVAGTITLLIGGVGIANYHLALLSERAVEIAVAKALGARNSLLIAQTVLESLLVSTGSAGLGILLGLTGCWALSQLRSRPGTRSRRPR